MSEEEPKAAFDVLNEKLCELESITLMLKDAEERGAEAMAMMAFDEGYDAAIEGKDNSMQPRERKRLLDRLMQTWRETKL